MSADDRHDHHLWWLVSEVRLALGTGWGLSITAVLPCGHRCELLREWIDPAGCLGRIACTEPGCRRVVERLVLEGWAAR
jgi:hypothetical protein